MKSFVSVAAPCLAMAFAAVAFANEPDKPSAIWPPGSEGSVLNRKPRPAELTWQELQERKPTAVCRVRFEIEATGTSVEEQLMLVAKNDWDAIILQPEQPSETQSNERFEVAVVGKAREAIARLGLSSADFKHKWIEVTGIPRNFTERWTHGDVAVAQFIVDDLTMIEVHSSNWTGHAFE